MIVKGSKYMNQRSRHLSKRREKNHKYTFEQLKKTSKKLLLRCETFLKQSKNNTRQEESTDSLTNLKKNKTPKYSTNGENDEP